MAVVADFNLVVVAGPNTGREFDVSGSTTIGRDQSSGIVIDDSEASRRHASFSVEDDGVRVEDLSSTNGTWVAGERIAAPRVVRPGEKIRVGTTVLEVRAVAQATQFAAPVAEPLQQVETAPDVER